MALVYLQLDQTQNENEAMRQEIDRTIELQVEERRAREQQMKKLQEQLDIAREDRAKAEAKVQKAIHGIAQIRAFHEIKKDHVNKLVVEKAELEEKLRKLKERSETTEEVVFE